VNQIVRSQELLSLFLITSQRYVLLINIRNINTRMLILRNGKLIAYTPIRHTDKEHLDSETLHIPWELRKLFATSGLLASCLVEFYSQLPSLSVPSPLPLSRYRAVLPSPSCRPMSPAPPEVPATSIPRASRPKPPPAGPPYFLSASLIVVLLFNSKQKLASANSEALRARARACVCVCVVVCVNIYIYIIYIYKIRVARYKATKRRIRVVKLIDADIAFRYVVRNRE